MTPRIYVAVQPQEFDLLFEPEVAARLRDAAEVDFAPSGTGKVPVPPGVGQDYDVLITSWSTAPFEPETLRGDRLRLAVHCAGSIRGLYPRQVLEDIRLAQGGAGAMATAVAEMALTLTLAVLRNLHIHDRGLQATHDWQAGGHGMLGQALHARRVGIVGLSRVGADYARMVRGVGAQHLTAFDPYVSPELADELGVELLPLEQVLAGSDVISVTAPATPETAGMLGPAELARIPDGAVLVNTARSAIVDEAALLAELSSGRLRAGLDVFDTEPLPSDSAFFGLENVILTPHVAGGTREARWTQGRVVAGEVSRFLDDGTLEHEVTAERYDRLA
ncbi:hydroxyacid dehydrogenase [Georgenia halophila]|uniref:Hydroxyacid dehydrogenase n=1 Tax=Georgenia halophila TaxID=620889 RepID=A0ABP8LJ82_9MICO